MKHGVSSLKVHEVPRRRRPTECTTESTANSHAPTPKRAGGKEVGNKTIATMSLLSHVSLLLVGIVIGMSSTTGGVLKDNFLRRILGGGVVSSSAKRAASSSSIDMDPFPLPPCTPDKTSAVYVAFGTNHFEVALKSAKSLRLSNFPGTIRMLTDVAGAVAANETLSAEDYGAVDEWVPLPLPDLSNKEILPHSNKIRALQAGAFRRNTNKSAQDNSNNSGENDDDGGGGGDNNPACTIFLDSDTYASPTTPWAEFLSVLELNDVGISKDCSVPIPNVPTFLNYWMPNTGVLALRDTPRTRLVLEDWLKEYIPCNATSFRSCMPGTDQYPFAQLLVRHAARVERLDAKWNCRCEGLDGGKKFPVYAMRVLSNASTAGASSSGEQPMCGGIDMCHILHCHDLDYGAMMA